MQQWKILPLIFSIGLSGSCSWEEDRGPLLVSGLPTGGGNLVWMADGTELVFVGYEAGTRTWTINAVGADRLVRQLDAPLYPNVLLARAGDGSALYFVGTDDHLRDALSHTAVAPRRTNGLGAIATSFD